jgi:hypothetical protein
MSFSFDFLVEKIAAAADGTESCAPESTHQGGYGAVACSFLSVREFRVEYLCWSYCYFSKVITVRCTVRKKPVF